MSFILVINKIKRLLILLAFKQLKLFYYFFLPNYLTTKKAGFKLYNIVINFYNGILFQK